MKTVTRLLKAAPPPPQQREIVFGPRTVPYTLHIPGEPPQTLRWTVHDPRSRHGCGVLLYRRRRDMLDGATFRALRDERGAWLDTDRPDQAREAMGLMQEESLGAPRDNR